MLAQLLGLILRPIDLGVALEVTEITVGLYLDQGRAVAAPRTRHRFAGGGINLQGVILLDAHAGYAIGRGALAVRAHRGRDRLLHGDRPFVVLAHEHHRQLPERREIERFVKRALVGGALAEARHRHPVLALLLGREREPARLRHAGADDATAAELVLRVEQVHVPALAVSEAGFLAEDLSGHAIQRHALGDGEMMRPVRTDHRVLALKVHAYPDCRRLLSCRQVHFARYRTRSDVERQPLLNVRRQLAFQIHLRHGFLVKADQQHLFVHPLELLGIRCHGWVSSDDPAVRTECVAGRARNKGDGPLRDNICPPSLESKVARGRRCACRSRHVRLAREAPARHLALASSAELRRPQPRR